MTMKFSYMANLIVACGVIAGCQSNSREAKTSSSKHQEPSAEPKRVKSADFQDKFDFNKADLSARGISRYMILQPGRRAEYRSKDGTLVITVLPETKTVDGVETAVVEERETKDGKLEEISRNYFAINRKTGDVYYFGEDVDEYKDGKIAGHGGSWLSGVDGARFGMLIPGQPRAGQKYYAEFAKNAKDRCEIKDTTAKVPTPLLGTFNDCLKIEETTPLEKDISHKTYAPNVGLIQDDEMVLVRVEGGAGQ